MARTKKPRKRPQPQSSTRNTRVTRVASPKTRLRPAFKILEDVAAAGDRAAMATPGADDPVVRFDAEILIRGVNGLKSVRLLLEHGHWENAVAVTRQLFELLVNMEYLGTLGDRRQATLKYCRFGVLQLIDSKLREARYNEKTGRPFDAEWVSKLELLRGNSFSDFQGKPKADGKVHFWQTWTGKKTKALAELSSSAMRAQQYDHLYSEWSEQTHATPSSLLDNIFRGADTDWVEEAIATDDRKTVETIMMTVVLFMELWGELPNVPELDPAVGLGWTNGLSEFALTVMRGK
ncbi:DUF5677 domain-containing protein [Kitasatospora sp. NPDC101183]|uniref:DUF5677 domain-containing protein n=1 Tax=Kitasatospora sp. NPDC101183 TaxID=3364100 RepID=UPI00381742EC